MASEIDICNLSLAYLGDTATVTSLYPPDGSAQAEHCARFYPIARNSLLEMHMWGFATKRVALALTSYTSSEWDYIYQQPSDMINAISVIPPDAQDDYSQLVSYPTTNTYSPEVIPAMGYYSPQPYQLESFDGTPVIMTDLENAEFRYTSIVTDTTKFSPLFVNSLSWYLASMLAGPLIKGDTGAAESKRCFSMFNAVFAEATVSASIQRNIKPDHIVKWMAGR